MPGQASLLHKALSTAFAIDGDFPSQKTSSHEKASAASGAADVPSAAPAGCPAPKPKATPLGRKRVRIPDMDKAIDDTTSVVAQAKKNLKAAAVQRRNAQRRRSRLVAKAAKLPADDLVKIAVYKRTNFLAHILDNNRETLKEGLKELVQNADSDSVQNLLRHLSEVAGSPVPNRTDTQHNGDPTLPLDPAGSASSAAPPAPLPLENGLQAPQKMDDGSEQFAESQALAAVEDDVCVEGSAEPEGNGDEGQE